MIIEEEFVVMEDNILNLLEHHSYSKEALQEKLHLSKVEIDVLLDKLKSEKLIYMNCYNKFSKVQSSHIIGRIESDTKNRKFIRANGTKIFIMSENLHTAFKNDLVVCEVYEANLGNVLGIIERKNNRLVCEVINKHHRLILVPFNMTCEVTLSLADKNLLKDYVEGDRAIVTLEDSVDETNAVIVHEIKKLGHKDDPKCDELSIAISKDFDVDFSYDAMRETLEIPDYVREKDLKNRVDLRDETIFTIDSIHTKDMDDAINIKKLFNGNYLLGVHIADVSHYVKPGMALYKDAEKRATSLYLGDTVIPMIPHKLSNGICSLNEGVDRLTKSCIMEINDKGVVVNYKLCDSVIHSKKKMTYEDLNKLFNDEEVDASYYPFIDDLQIMRELSNILTKNKNKRGNLEFESNEIKVHNNDLEQPVEFTVHNNQEAESLIENFMILANETVASYFYWQDLPFIYRVHNLPDEEKLERTVELIHTIGSKIIKLQNSYGQKAIQNILNEYKGTPEYSIISNLLLRNMSKAQYSPQNIGHFALALDNYCHSTSPIRRFPDLVIQHLLNIFNKDYSKNNPEKLYERLDVISHHSSYKERQADDAERDYLKLKMAEYMANYVGEEFIGIIVDIEKDSVIIKLENNIKGMLAYTEDFSNAFYIDSINKELKSTYSKCKARLGTLVTIKVHEVNIPAKEIFFELIEIHKDKELVRKKKND